MRALLLPAAGGSDGSAEGEGRIPDECAALIWHCLSLPERMCCSALSPASRQTAPPVVHLAAAAQRLCRALASPSSGPQLREVRSLAELVVSKREGLRPHIPAATSLLCGLVRCPGACRATRQVAIGGLGWLLSTPRYVYGVFGEYDCDVSGPSVMEPCLETLAWATSQNELRPKAVEVLVVVMRAIMTGVHEAAAASSNTLGTGGAVASGSSGSQSGGHWAAAWAERRRRGCEARGLASAFNRDPEAWWQEHAGGCNAKEAARFLLSSRGALDGSRVGDFLGQHEDVMAEFVRQFELKGLGIVPAFSRVLRGLHMPGEAQQIDRFCERFGAAWGEANDIDPEAAYIFAFSLVMLSTDLHRPASTGHEHMTFAQFEKSLHGALPKGRLPEGVVREAYSEIKANPLLSRGRSEEQERPTELCVQLRRALCRQPPAKPRSLAAPLADGLVGLWRTLWSAAWGPMLGAFSAGAHGAGEDEARRETALRGLQLGCQAAVLLEEVEQAQAFSQALQQLSPTV
uniref:SEC7 domain-containing protein n=1 Tax=Pyrodinium bahamense TaxID=73915 RepID=A0A7S0B8R3_9DINO